MSALLSAVELVMAKTIEERDQGDPLEWHNKIPPILHPMGKHWEQPDMSRVLIDDTHAIMDQKTFDGLHDYSRSFPSGVYPGKCWRRLSQPHEEKYWWLLWFGYSDAPDCCSNNWRKILIV